MINLTPYANFTMRSLRSQRIWPRNSSPLPIFAFCSLRTNKTNEIFSHIKKKVFTGLYCSLKMLITSHNSVAYRTTFIVLICRCCCQMWCCALWSHFFSLVWTLFQKSCSCSFYKEEPSSC